MGKNLKINEYSGLFMNPAVQLNTSITQIVNEAIDLPSNDEMQFTSDLVDNYSPLGESEPFRIFKVDDPLTYRKFDPQAINAAKEQNKHGEQSGNNAANINPVINQ